MAAPEIDQGGECIAIARMVRIGFLVWGAASRLHSGYRR